MVFLHFMAIMTRHTDFIGCTVKDEILVDNKSNKSLLNDQGRLLGYFQGMTLHWFIRSPQSFIGSSNGEKKNDFNYERNMEEDIDINATLYDNYTSELRQQHNIDINRNNNNDLQCREQVKN